jgi:uncharacterized protein YhaN
MRLRRLDLTRYGKFTDHRLEFGAAPADGPDFHIIYGPNEAGKSTTMQGWLDLLYGIPTQSRMNFRHDYAAMQLGAVIEGGDALHEVIRTKGRQGTLTDGAGHILSDSLLQGLLGGIDRAGYEAMFSLDDDTLEKGGESILSSQGDLGQMLFAAASGLAEMGQALDGLRARGAAFFKPGGRTGGLADLKKSLAAIEAQIAEQDVGARDVAALMAARDAAQADFDAAQTAQDATVAALDLVERQWAALPWRNRLMILEAELAALPDLPPLPEGWADEAGVLLRSHGDNAVRIEGQVAQLAMLQADMDAAVDDPDVLAMAAAVDAAAALKSDYDGAVRDLPARRGEAAHLQAQVADLLRRLGAEGQEPARVVPPAAAVAAIRALIERYSGIAAAADSAQHEVEVAARRLEDLAAQRDATGPAQPDLAVLEGVIQAEMRHDPTSEVARTRSLAMAAQDRMEVVIAALAPWRGDGVALSGLVLPDPAQVQAWRQTLADLSQDAARLDAAVARLDDEIAQVTTQARSALATGQPTLADLAALRAVRERLWAVHRDELTPDSATAFEAALRQDDQATAAMAQAQSAAQQRAEAAARLDGLVITRERLIADAAAVAQRRDAVQAAVQTALPPGLDPATSPDGLDAWLRRRGAALEGYAAWQAAARDHKTAQARHDAAVASVAAALRAVGLTPAADAPLAVLVAQAQVALEQARGQASLIAAHAAAAAELTRRQSAQAQALAARDAWTVAWQAAWEAACQAANAGQDRGVAPDVAPDVAGMSAVLELWQALDRDLHALLGLQDRIGKMQDNRAAFAAAVAAIAQALDLPPDETGPVWNRIVARRQAAQQGQEQRLALGRKIAAGKAMLGDLRAAQALAEARLAEIGAYFGGVGQDSLVATLEAARARQGLRTEYERLARDICEGMAETHLDAALAALDGLDRPTLAAAREGLRAARDRQAQALQQSYGTLMQAQHRIDAVGGDAAVARLHEQAQTLTLQIAEETRAFLRQRLGIMAVDHALKTYRDSHRSAMMQRASLAFRTITRGEYSGLAAQPEAEREVLVAIAADGTSKLARDLSKGTRFQLYLALRVAGYHEIAGNRSTVPFIADDIMETFDNDRAAETFGLLADMARVGQVIYLTHHMHLCEIAQAVCPMVRIHSLR